MAQLTSLQRQCLMTWATGGWWSEKRKLLAGFDDSDGKCPCCDKDAAGVWHVLFECPVTEHIRQDTANFDEIRVFLEHDARSKELFKRG